MAHLIRTLALGGWVLMGTWVAPRMGTTALEVAREQLQAEDARARQQQVRGAPLEREASTPQQLGAGAKRLVVPPPSAPVDASAGSRI